MLKKEKRPIKCLGLFLDGKILPVKYFDPMLERARKRISLLKTVLQALLIYMLASGWVPMGMLEKLERDLRLFIWELGLG